MDDFHPLALSTEESIGDALLPPRVSLSTAELSKREDLREQGDRELIGKLLEALQTTPGQALPAPDTPVAIAELSLLGQWGDVFHKAVNQLDFLEWADGHDLQFDTIQVRIGVLQAQVGLQAQLHTYTLADDSGWWRVANPIIFIAQLLDPAGLGMPYIGERGPIVERTLSLDRVLAFYGYPMPANRLQAQVMVDELQALEAFPTIDDVGLNRSLIHAELLNQQRDFTQLADALQGLEGFNSFTLYTHRLQLSSDSLLARSLKEAAGLLKAVIEDNRLEGELDTSGDFYFDHQRHVVCALPRLDQGKLLPGELRPDVPDIRWLRLTRLAEKAGAPVYQDHSLTLAAVLQAYGIPRIYSEPELAPLIERLRQWPLPQAPTVYAAARSLDERFIQSQYIGLRNDRHAMRQGLYNVLRNGVLNGPQGLDAMIEVDADTLHAAMEPGRRQLQALVELPAFVAIREAHAIDPKSHVLISATGGIGALGLDGRWRNFTDAVMANAILATKVRQLLPQVSRAGGQLRTNDAISLVQALRYYSIAVPTTLDEVQLAAQRRAITAPQLMHESNYWRALKPEEIAQPAAWTLSQSERQQVITISQKVLPHPDQHLFNYLCQPVLAGKSRLDIRAEADLLMIRLIATPRAQHLADLLSRSLQWHGSHASDATTGASRSALVWAALILSLDPEPGAHPTRINGLDWTDADFWAEPISFVRLQLECCFRDLDAGAGVLAAHLMLSGQAPYLLVRDIPDSMPFLSTQAWVLFQQYCTYLEHRLPGSARQMSHDEIMYLAYLPPRGGWSTFLEGSQPLASILGWAVTNGILPRQPRYSATETNLAIATLNALRERLKSALDAFAKPILSRRQFALQTLQKVYPKNRHLEDLVLMWLPEDSPFSEDNWFENVHVGKKYSFVDLYMADRLDVTSRRWHSADPRIKYREMARSFHQFKPCSELFAQAFSVHLHQLQVAFKEYLQNGLPQLSLLRREAIEFGQVDLFTLRLGPGPVGSFGVILCVSFYSDRYVYECFPKYLLLRPRRDLDYTTLMQIAASADQDVSTVGFHWLAYANGAEPSELDTLHHWTGLRLSPLGSPLPAVEALPLADAHGRRVPSSFDSARSKALAAIIIDQHFLLHGSWLREQASVAPPLERASDADPWADYLRSVAMASM